MKTLLIGIVLSQAAWAQPCVDRAVDNTTHTCLRFAEPELSKVQFDEKAREFRYEFPYQRVAYVTRSVFTCWGQYRFSENLVRTVPGVIPFSQAEEGNADFTLIREIRAYLDTRQSETCLP